MIQEHAWMEQLETLIQEKHMLTHPLYKAWTCGMLSKASLQEYAKEYYHHVKAFPTYISALHSRCEDPTTRRLLLENLIDEEAGNPNHPDLWKAFALALGVTEFELNTHKPSAQTQALIATFQDLCCNAPVPVGIAALYCYESQIPAICATKIDGLKKWYGLNQPSDYRYFTVHETADVEHSSTEKELLIKLVEPAQQAAVLQGAGKGLNLTLEFLEFF